MSAKTSYPSSSLKISYFMNTKFHATIYEIEGPALTTLSKQAIHYSLKRCYPKCLHLSDQYNSFLHEQSSLNFTKAEFKLTYAINKRLSALKKKTSIKIFEHLSFI